jgi:hypothetical protein
MTIQTDPWLKITAGIALLIAAQTPSAAWEEQGGALKSLPSGGLMLKEVPGTDSKLQNLPGVRLNPQALNNGGTNCTQRQVSAYRYGFGEQSATVSECNFGNFSVTTYGSRPGGASGYDPFPVPGPLQQAGPPPGSGGFAPGRRSLFD